MRIALQIWVLALTILLTGSAYSEQALRVACSINPIGSLARNVGQQHVSVTTIVSGQSDVHGFELRPSQMKVLYRADLILHNGLGLEHWARGFDEKLKGKLLELSSAVPEAAWNMHIWLDPQLVAKQVKFIADKLCDLQKVNCQDFHVNAANFIEKLRLLDLSLQQEISAWHQKKYVAYHRSWDHFSRRYGLQSVGEFQVTHSTETTIKSLKAVLDAARGQEVGVFWLDAQASSDRVASVVEDAGLKIVRVDELGMEGEDYISMMRRNVQNMSEAMKQHR